MIHLDTSFLIRAFPTGSPEERALEAWIDADETLAMSAVAWMEFLSGPLEPPELEFATGIIDLHIDFAPTHAEIAARLFNLSGQETQAVRGLHDCGDGDRRGCTNCDHQRT